MNLNPKAVAVLWCLTMLTVAGVAAAVITHSVWPLAVVGVDVGYTIFAVL